MDTLTPLRVGLVGFGEIAQYHLRHLESHGAPVVGVVTTRPTPPHLRRFPSLERMLPEVDAVTIAVPNHLHADLCVQVMLAGKPALVEKPLCITADGLAAVEAVAAGHARTNPPRLPPAIQSSDPRAESATARFA